jgi:hypothetical protein
MECVVQKMREQLFGLGQDAVDSLRRAMQNETDGKIARQFLGDIGVIPSRGKEESPQTGGRRNLFKGQR